MAPSRRVSRQQTRNAPRIQGGIRRRRREERNAARPTDANATSPEQRAGSLPPAITLGSEVSESSPGTLSSESPESSSEPEPEPETHQQPEPIDLPTLNNILQQREDHFLNRILTHLASEQTIPQLRNHTRAAARDRSIQPLPWSSRPMQGPGEETSDTHSMYSPLPIHEHEESASAAMDSVEAWFPGVERATLTQIIENRFKPTNIYCLLASEKDRAESQWVINIGGVCFEQGEREGREIEYRMGYFFKAWAAYCGILTKLAPAGLQCDLACSLHIYTMNLHDLAERYTWEGVKAYHFQFHWKRIASGKEVYHLDDWRKLDPELIFSKCFLFPKPTSSYIGTTPRGLFGQRVDHATGTGPGSYHRPAIGYTPATSTIATPGSSSEARNTRAGQWLPSSSCRNWNYRECQVQQCRYLHACISCGGNHRASQCTGRGMSGGKNPIR